MKTETFDGRKITIRKPTKEDLKHIKKFQDFINSLIEERAKITHTKKKLLREEKDWLEGVLKGVRKHRRLLLIAEHNGLIVGTTGIDLGKGRSSHVGRFGITIRKGYRGIGLGRYLMGEVLRAAEEGLKPPPKIIRLSVFPDNKPAINLYKKFGFKKVATIPKQFEYEDKLLNEIVMLLYL